MENIKELLQFEATELDKGKRLDIFLNECIEDSTRSYVEKIIDLGHVTVSEKVQKKNGKKLKGNENIVVEIPLEEESELTPENIPLNIIYEDEDIVVVNKNSDMVVHPAYGNYSGTLVNALLYYAKNLSDINGSIRPGIVHRLDKNTSGIIIVAKNNSVHSKLGEMFLKRKVSKTYLCIVKGMFSPENMSGRIETLIGRDRKDRKRMAVRENSGKNAISNYRVLAMSNNISLLEVEIETGRTHQIRVHMKHINHPILGDEVYGTPDKKAKRQMLHAYKLEFNHPIKSENMVLRASLPDDFLEVCDKNDIDILNIINGSE